MGSRPLLPDENDKPAVIALREIAAGLVSMATVDAIDAKEKGEDLFQVFNDATR
ncbi:MAG: DNA-directed RNA polymerase subunit omega [Gammaproteobacteria bacterium]